jgi:hypothetical protein
MSHTPFAPARVSRVSRVLLASSLASSAALAIALGLVACQDTFSNPLPLYDAATEDGNGLPAEGTDSGNGGGDDASAPDAGDASKTADAGDAGNGGDATVDGGEQSDAGDASAVDAGDAATDADAG